MLQSAGQCVERFSDRGRPSTGSPPSRDRQKGPSLGCEIAFDALPGSQLIDRFTKAPCIPEAPQQVRCSSQRSVVLQTHHHHRPIAALCDDHRLVIFAYLLHCRREILPRSGVGDCLHMHRTMYRLRRPISWRSRSARARSAGGRDATVIHELCVSRLAWTSTNGGQS